MSVRGAVFVCLSLMLLGACGEPLSQHTAASDAPPKETDAPLWLPHPKWPSLQTGIRRYELEIAPADHALMLARPHKNVEVPATFTVDGHRHAATVRFRGRFARSFPKKSFKVKLTQGEFDGRTSFNLVAEYMDTTLIAEKFALDLFAAAGVPAPRAWYGELWFNGAYAGVYLDIEQVGSRFLQARGYGRTAPLYRCGQSDCELKDTPATSWQEAWTQKTKDSDDDDPQSLDPADFPPLHDFLKLINHTPPGRFDETLEKAMDVDENLRFYEVSTILPNDYEEDSRSYLARSEATGRWHYVPWDLNNTRLIYNRRSSVKHSLMGDRPLWPFSACDPVVQERVIERRAMWPDMRPTWSTLNTRIREQPELRRRALDTLEWWTNEVFEGDFWAGRVQAQLALITPSVQRDPHVPQDCFARAATFHPQYAERRKAYLLGRIAEERAAMDVGALVVNEVSHDGWVKVHNPTSRALDAGGLWSSPDPRHPGRKQLPSPLSVPAGGMLLLGADELGFSPKNTRQMGLFRHQDGTDPVEVLLHGALPTDGTSYGRYPDGAADWRPMPPTLNEPNAR